MSLQSLVVHSFSNRSFTGDDGMIISCAHVVAPMAHVRHVLEWAEGVAEYRDSGTLFLTLRV